MPSASAEAILTPTLFELDPLRAPVNTAANLINSNDAAVEGGYTISRENLNTNQNVRLDNLQYGDTFPAGSF